MGQHLGRGHPASCASARARPLLLLFCRQRAQPAAAVVLAGRAPPLLAHAPNALHEGGQARGVQRERWWQYLWCTRATLHQVLPASRSPLHPQSLPVAASSSSEEGRAWAATPTPPPASVQTRLQWADRVGKRAGSCAWACRRWPQPFPPPPPPSTAFGPALNIVEYSEPPLPLPLLTLERSPVHAGQLLGHVSVPLHQRRQPGAHLPPLPAKPLLRRHLERAHVPPLQVCDGG